MRCYFLVVAGGSSLDRHTNNVTLFNLVEQLNYPKDRPPPPGVLLPLELHAYFHLDPEETGRSFEVRFTLVAQTGLETPTDAFSHRSTTGRYRTRTLGLPMPPVAGSYSLCVDTRQSSDDTWHRHHMAWPFTVAEVEPRPRVTH